MKEFIELAATRQSCRAFSDKPVEREKLIRIVEAARLAPSACNSQPWSFLIVTDPERVRRLSEGAMGAGGNQWAPTVKAYILVLEEYAVLNRPMRNILNSQYFAPGDLGAATVYISLQAASMGLGACIIGTYDREYIYGAFGIEPGRNVASLVAVGYPKDETVRPKQRKPLDAIYTLYE